MSLFIIGCLVIGVLGFFCCCECCSEFDYTVHQPEIEIPIEKSVENPVISP